ncbi:hypothetical protein M758_3G181600 [Ceratodon purpureus]|nr:hypothetical protein M758_3G181600 [Ceratodon purpureus]
MLMVLFVGRFFIGRIGAVSCGGVRCLSSGGRGLIFLDDVELRFMNLLVLWWMDLVFEEDENFGCFNGLSSLVVLERRCRSETG